MRAILAVICLISSLAAGAADLLPYRFEYHTGDVQAMNDESLVYIDNSSVYLNPDRKGQHESYFLYKVADPQEIPNLEVRAKGRKGIYEFAVLVGKEWQPLGTIKVKDQWTRIQFALGSKLADYADADGVVKVRVRAQSKKVTTLELDYIGLTTDQPVAETGKSKGSKEAALELKAPAKTAEI